MAAAANRYARAFVDVIESAKLDVSIVVGQLRSLVAAFEQSGELRAVWESQGIPGEQKRKVLDALAAKIGITDRPVRNLVAVLIDQDRTALLPEIAKQLDNELNSRQGRIAAEIVSARELGPELRSSLISEISCLTGKTVAPKYAVDKKLIGGVIVRVGSTIYDGSVRGQLQRIRQRLSEN